MLKSNEQESNRKRIGIYLLPNLLTLTGLFAGFFCIVSAMKGHFDSSAKAIFVAMIMDGLDGRVARLTQTESAFGTELDSLADIVSFGVAPALAVYSWSLFHLGKVGWLVAFFFAAAGALRLARFNTQVAVADKRYFQGLPIPAAAGVIASILWLCQSYSINNSKLSIVIMLVTLWLAVLMVSNIRFHSFKKLNFSGRVSFFSILCVLSALVAIAINPPLVLFIIFISYVISGQVLTLKRLQERRKQRRAMRKIN